MLLCFVCCVLTPFSCAGMEPSTIQYDLSVADGSQFNNSFLKQEMAKMESSSGVVIKPDDV